MEFLFFFPLSCSAHTLCERNIWTHKVSQLQPTPHPPPCRSFLKFRKQKYSSNLSNITYYRFAASAHCVSKRFEHKKKRKEEKFFFSFLPFTNFPSLVFFFCVCKSNNNKSTKFWSKLQYSLSSRHIYIYWRRKKREISLREEGWKGQELVLKCFSWQF